MIPDQSDSLADKFPIRFLLMPSTGPRRVGQGDDPATIHLLLGADNLCQGLAGGVEQADRQAAYWKNQAWIDEGNLLV